VRLNKRNLYEQQNLAMARLAISKPDDPQWAHLQTWARIVIQRWEETHGDGSQEH